MTERWISTKKHYCKYCNTWIPDTRISHTSHEASDRHKNAMQRNLTRIQRDELIKRNSGGNVYAPKPVAAAGVGGGRTMEKKTSLANYGYGERDDMIGFIREGRKIKFDEVPGAKGESGGGRGYSNVPVREKESNVGKWEVTQIISKPEDVEGGEKHQVKEEDSEDQGYGMQGDISRGETREGQKRERKRTPDVEDLLRFKVEEKTFPTQVKEEGEMKVPVVGFKKRKIGMKNSRVSGAL